MKSIVNQFNEIAHCHFLEEVVAARAYLSMDYLCIQMGIAPGTAVRIDKYLRVMNSCSV